jgi:TonB-linked SusC/RagA family outer membrane protein
MPNLTSTRRYFYPGCFKLLLFAFFLLPLAVFAQTKVTGTVLDGAKPVSGASVQFKRKTAGGTVTNAAGQFTLNANSGDTLIVTAVGFESTVIVVTAKTSYVVNLVATAKDLDDVVVIAYGNTSRRLASNAITTVTGKQIADMPVASPAEALVGLTPGVLIGTPSGEPGSNPYIRVRGLGSLGAGNNPLFVVDGYPLNSGDNFYNINSQDIESIQVLKDAASAAMYGSRGGNGIVMVTTKRAPASGKTVFGFNAYTGISNVSKKVKVLDGPQYVDYVREAYTNLGQPVPLPYVGTPTEPYANTDWQDVAFHTGTQNNYSLSASGGTDASRFYISGNYFKQTGIVAGSGYQRMLVRANFDSRLSSRLKIGLTIAPSFTSTDTKPIAGSFNSASITGGGPGNLGAVVTDALLLPPTWGIMSANGDYVQALNTPLQIGIGGLFNPVATTDLYQDKTSTFRGLGYMFAEYQLAKGLTYRANVGGEILNNQRTWYIPATLATNAAPTANLSNPILANINARLQNNTSTNWLVENLLTYTRNAGDHRFTVLGGYSAQKNVYQGGEAFGQNGTYTNSALDYVTAAGQIFGAAAATGNTLSSIFARLDYSYKYRYILSASLRKDGSSRFGDDNKFATFPAASIAWRILEERFMQPLRKKGVSELKFKTSFGVTGNNNIGDYNWQSYQTPANAVLGSGSGNVVFGLAPNSVPIKNLSWEQSQQVDVGLELGLFNNRVYITADWYQKNTTSLLLNRNVPGVIGYTSRVFSNVGEVKNTGFDFSINTQNIVHKDFSWTTDANFFLFRNKVVSLANPNDQILFDAVFGYTSSIRVVPGLPMGGFYGYRQIGVYKDAADVANSAVWSAGGSVPGDMKYQDVNGDKIINAGDITLLGSPFPDFSYGITNNFRYKQFSLSIGIQGNVGGNVLNGVERYTLNSFGRFNARANVLNRWKSASDPGDGFTPRLTSVSASSLTAFSSYELSDASFLRIRNVSLRYTVPQKWVKNAKLQNFSIYMSAQNLYTFAKYFGYNPEANLYGNSVNPTYGVDQGSYPLNRTFTLGVNLGF